MIMFSKFLNFPDKLSENDELREYELNGSDCTFFEPHSIVIKKKKTERSVEHCFENM